MDTGTWKEIYINNYIINKIFIFNTNKKKKTRMTE